MADGGAEQEYVDGSVGPGGSAGTGGRRRAVALWCALALVVAGVAGVVARHGEGHPPEAELARIRAFVKEAGAAHFTGTTRSEYGNGADEPGSTSIDVSRLEGAFVLPDRLHLVDDSGGAVDETVLVPAGAYERGADDRAGLATAQWAFTPHGDAGRLPLWAVSVDGGDGGYEAAGASLLGAVGSPFDVARLLDHLHGARRVSSGVLEAQTTMRELLPAEMVTEMERLAGQDHGIDDAGSSPTGMLDGRVTVRLVHAADGRLDELDVTEESGTGEDRSVDRTELRFSGWGDAVAVEAPARGDVDPTPGVDEDDLAAFAAFAPLAPAAPPAGMVLESAEASPEDAGEETCAEVSLHYGPAQPPPADGTPYHHVEISEVSDSCQWKDDDAGFEPLAGQHSTVRVGPYQAEVSELRIPGEHGPTLTSVKLTAGTVVVSAQSDLPVDQLVAALATLGPLDLAAQPVARREPPAG